MAKDVCYFKHKIHCNIQQNLTKQFILYSTEAYSESLPNVSESFAKMVNSFAKSFILGVSQFCLSIWVFFHKHSQITEQQEKRGVHFFISSLPLPPNSKAFRHQPEDHCSEVIFALSQLPDSIGDSLVSERKSLTTKLAARPPPLSAIKCH